ncbi:MAG: helix-turn-helix domain-containing protein [Spirochaetaceae bacterium]|jgi:hypothetical protein|nr:helix-turn-helix domain-containing protein [Spirochaetaceae bacterium]
MSDGEGLTDKTVKNYYKSVSEAINRAMRQRGVTQDNLVRDCENMEVAIAQSTISKIVNYTGKGHLSLIHIAAICQILKIDMNEVLPLRGKDYSAVSKEYKYDDAVLNETLIEDPNHSAFLGYWGRTFDIFFFPTISSESGILKGTLSLTNENDAYCGAAVNLKMPKDGMEKKYAGRMLVSLQQQACYINLVSKRLGEMCSLYFFHRFFSETSLKVRMAVAVTICAGDDRRPTMHRVVICEQGIINTDDEEQMHFIGSQLLLNDSQIWVKEQDLQNIGKDPRFTKIVDEMVKRKLARPDEEGAKYICFEESDILKLPNCEFHDIAEVIGLMRRKGDYKRYNKIGSKADAMLYKYLFEKDTTKTYS